MKLNELISQFEIFMSNEEEQVYNKLGEPTHYTHIHQGNKL